MHHVEPSVRLVGSSCRVLLLFLVLNDNAMLGEQFYLWLRLATDFFIFQLNGFGVEIKTSQVL